MTDIIESSQEFLIRQLKKQKKTITKLREALEKVENYDGIHKEEMRHIARTTLEDVFGKERQRTLLTQEEGMKKVYLIVSEYHDHWCPENNQGTLLDEIKAFDSEQKAEDYLIKKDKTKEKDNRIYYMQVSKVR